MGLSFIYIILLFIGAEERDGDGGPPDGGDHEGDRQGLRLRHAQFSRENEEHEADDEGHDAPDVAPGVALGGDLVEPVLGRHVSQHGIVKNQAPGKSSLCYDKYDQKQQPLFGKPQCQTTDCSNHQSCRKNGLFKTFCICQCAKNRSHDSHNNCCHRCRIAPVCKIIHRRKPCLFSQIIKINWHDR